MRPGARAFVAKIADNLTMPPVDAWHDVIDEPTFADAILDRIVHNAHRLNLDGHSMRKTHDAPKIIDGDAND